MTSTHKVPKKLSAILAIIILLPALYIFFVWLKVSGNDVTATKKIEDFTDHFPVAFNEFKMIIYISIASCVGAIVLAAKSFKQRSLFLRIAMWLTVMLASLIFFLNIFQLL